GADINLEEPRSRSRPCLGPESGWGSTIGSYRARRRRQSGLSLPERALLLLARSVTRGRVAVGGVRRKFLGGKSPEGSDKNGEPPSRWFSRIHGHSAADAVLQTWDPT